MAFISPSSPQKCRFHLRFISISPPPSPPLHLGSQSYPHTPVRAAPALRGGVRAISKGLPQQEAPDDRP